MSTARIVAIVAVAVSALVVPGSAMQPRVTNLPSHALHAYVTTGDAQWDSRYEPLDSVETISSFFEHLAAVQHVSRVYWRGGRSLTHLKNFLFRQENPQRYDYWTDWEHHLNVDLDLNRVAEREAHRRGIEIFMIEALFDFGGTGETEYGGQLPFYGEDRIRLDHPEWIPVDRWGDRRQAGTIELAYPEARRALIDRFTQGVVDGGYDGLFLYTYAENFATRFEDEFGFNDPIVVEYRRRYGIAIRTESFDRARWGRLRGEYVTAFLDDLHQALAARGKKLTITLSPSAPDRTQRWPSTSEQFSNSIRLDWQSWITHGTVDEIAVMGSSDAGAITFAEQILAVGTSSVRVTIFTESPLHARFVPLVDRGVSLTGWCAPYRGVMEQYSLMVPSAEDLRSEDWMVRAQAAAAAGGRTLDIPATALAALVRDPHVVVRRQAIRALAALNARDEKKTIEAALNDPEESVRVAAVASLGTIGDFNSARAIRDALRANARFMIKETAVQTLATLGRTTVLLEAIGDPSAAVRQVSIRALARVATQLDVPSFLTAARTDADEQVRYYAMEALRNWPQPAVATFFLMEARNPSVTLQLRAVRGIASTSDFLSTRQRAEAIWLLEDLFAQYGGRSTRSDADWGWRVVARALRGLGDEGTGALEAFRMQTADPTLATRAYYALYINQREGEQATGNWEEDERTHIRFAPPSTPAQ